MGIYQLAMEMDLILHLHWVPGLMCNIAAIFRKLATVVGKLIVIGSIW